MACSEGRQVVSVKIRCFRQFLGVIGITTHVKILAPFTILVYDASQHFQNHIGTDSGPYMQNSFIYNPPCKPSCGLNVPVLIHLVLFYC